MAMWGQIAGAIIGGMSTKSAAKSNEAANKAAAELAYKQSLPWSTSGMMGGAGFDEKTRQATMTLDPTLQAPYYAWLARANRGAMRQAEMEGSPYEMGQKFYEAERAVYAPGQAQDRLALENRLLAQGMLGSTGGAGQTQALREAQSMQDLARQSEAFGRAQDYYGLQRQRELGDIQSAIDLGRVPLEYANLGRGIGSDMGVTARQGAEMASGAAATNAKALSGWGRGVGTSIADYYNPNKSKSVTLNVEDLVKGK
jgi:hypothetical protein